MPEIPNSLGNSNEMSALAIGAWGFWKEAVALERVFCFDSSNKRVFFISKSNVLPKSDMGSNLEK